MNSASWDGPRNTAMRYGSPLVHYARLRSDFAPQQLAYSARTDEGAMTPTEVTITVDMDKDYRLIECHDLIVFEFILATRISWNTLYVIVCPPCSLCRFPFDVT